MELRAPHINHAPTSSFKGPMIAMIVLQISTLSLALYAISSPKRGNHSGDPGRIREVAGKLRGAGITKEAADLYETYLENGSIDRPTRANIAYSVGQMYLNDGRYEPALRWFYESESLGGPTEASDLQTKIVHALERLGRVHAAQAVLTTKTRLDDPSSAPKHGENDAVVAKIGDKSVHRSEVQRALDDLPPALAERFSGATARREFLRKFVADEMLWRKAQKLEYGDDPEVRRQLDALYKQLVVGRFIEKEVIGKIEIAQEDLAAFFEANKARYTPKKVEGQPAPPPPELAKVLPQVERDYRLMKVQAEYQRVIAEQLGTAEVQLFEEAMEP